ncbi:MAG: hypothetical protein KBT02_01290 [Treponema sp.]|nr:hypothetical protein [Candidatus Treponema caballi]
MELNFKKTLTILFSTIILSAVAAESSFAGFAGVSLDLQPADNTLEVYAKGVVAGQYALNDTLSFRGNFQFGTGDIVSNGLFRETPSTFSINELSGTYSFYTEGRIRRISALLGDQNSFGSDTFVKQTLGVHTFESSLLTPAIAPVSANMHLFSGVGFSYVDDFGPNALSINAFYDTSDDGEKTPQLNGAFRYAFLAGDSIFDTDFGLTLPVENKTESGEEVFILIKSIILHGGLSTVINITDRMNLFLQAGVSDINIQNIEAPGLDNLHLFIEPRIALSSFNLNVSFFNISDAALRNLQTVSHPLGCNLNIETLPFLMLSHTATAGLDVTASSQRTVDISNPETIDVVITPHLDYSMFSGNLKTSVLIHPLEYMDMAKFFKLSLSFKAQF